MKTSRKVALGGMVTAVSVMLMFLTGVFPFATFALPGIAGLLLIMVVIEMGCRQAVVVYVAVSILAVFITPDREAALFYVIFLGYYPIVKSKLEQLKSRVVEYILKFALFTAAVAVSYVGMVYLFHLEEIVPGPIWLVVGYLFFAFTFWLYDQVMSMLIEVYLKKIRPNYLKKLFK